MMMLLKIAVAVACLAACVSESSARRSNNQLLVPSASQVAPQAISPNEQANKQAQQAKLHYMEIGPSLKGDYKFGYDTGSGPAGQSFREETRLDDGTVKGAYGYVDANGKQRIVKYTAGKAGFVVESDQEAGNQANQQAQAQQPQQAPAAPQPVHRPTPVAPPHHAPTRQHVPVAAPVAPVAAPQQQQAGPVSFDEPAPALTRQQAEAQHAQQLRQHQLAQQHALAQQQQLAQQQEQQQQLLIQQQQAQQALAQQQQAQQQHQQAQHHAAPAPAAHAQPQFSAHQHQSQQPQFNVPQPHAAPQQHQHQFSAPAQHHHNHLHQQAQAQQPQHHQPAPIVHQFNQNGHFFAQSNDANLGQLLAQQLQQLQQQQQQHQQPQFQAQSQPDFATPNQIPQRFAAPQQQQFNAQPQESSAAHQPDFNQGHQVRASRHAHFQPEQQQPRHNVASPQSALLALHQQQQHDAQILANLRAQQLAQLEQQQRQQSLSGAVQAPASPAVAPTVQSNPQPAHHQAAAFQQQQSAPVQQFAAHRPSAHHQARIAQAPAQPIAESPAPVQPEVFGPPVIDIRTLNYSIGQQTRVQ